MGAVLAPGKRTVSSCLRMTGRAAANNFSTYHQILNRARWDTHAMARRLLIMIIDRLVPEGPVVIGMDDTIERRWGRKITARGIYRDPVRSSHGHFVKASGLRWLSFMVLTPVPWAGVVKALPVFTLLAPSERSNRQRGRRHKLLTDWARQGTRQLCRWLPASPYDTTSRVVATRHWTCQPTQSAKKPFIASFASEICAVSFSI